MKQVTINPVKLDDDKQKQVMRAIVLANASSNEDEWVKLRRQDVFELNDNNDEGYGLLYSVYVKSLGNNKYQCYVVDRKYPKGSFCKVPDVLQKFEVDASNTQQPITIVKLQRPQVFIRPYSTDKVTLQPQKTRGFDPEATLFAPRLREGEKPLSFVEQAELAKGTVTRPFFNWRYFQTLVRTNFLQENTLAALRDLGMEDDVEVVDIQTEKKRSDGYMAAAQKIGLIMPKLGEYDLDSKAFSEYDDTQLQSIALTLCQAVQRLHAVGRVHRDIKPANIRIGEVDGKLVAYLIDLGLNCKANNTEQDLAGSPAYIPREAWVQSAKRDYPIDIYALSLTLFRLIFAKDKKAFHPSCLEHHPPGFRNNMAYRNNTYWDIYRNKKEINKLPGPQWQELYDLIERGFDPNPEERPKLEEFIKACEALPANATSQVSSPRRLAAQV